MTFREVYERFYCAIEASGSVWPVKGFSVFECESWVEKERIPLAHIPEIAEIIGVKPSEIDEFFIGKDHITIDWESKDV